VWDAATGKCLQTLQGDASFVTSVCVTPDGLRLFSGSVNGTIKVWDVAPVACLQTLEGHKEHNSIIYRF
jgi:WD40 repeat protein